MTGTQFWGASASPIAPSCSAVTADCRESVDFWELKGVSSQEGIWAQVGFYSKILVGKGRALLTHSL